MRPVSYILRLSVSGALWNCADRHQGLVSEDVSPEIEVVDVGGFEVGSCDPSPCGEDGFVGCSLDRTATVQLQPACVAARSGPRCEFEEGVNTLCSDGPCLLGACLSLPDRCVWPYSERVSYVSQIAFLGEPACCHDFDDDGEVDNAFARALKRLAPAIGNFDDLVRYQIENRSMNLLLDVMGPDTAIDVIGYESNFDNVSFVDPQTGMASMKLKLSSFLDEVDWIPRNRASGRIRDGHIEVERGRLAFVSFLNDKPVELLIEDMHFEGEVAVGPNGKGLVIDGDGGRGARLWGRIAKTSVLETLNAEFQSACCTTYSEADGKAPVDVARGRCNRPVATCTELLGLCRALSDPETCELVLKEIVPDLDADGDGERDALSVGLHFKATSAAVGWMESCGPAPTETE